MEGTGEAARSPAASDLDSGSTSTSSEATTTSSASTSHRVEAAYGRTSAVASAKPASSKGLMVPNRGPANAQHKQPRSNHSSNGNGNEEDVRRGVEAMREALEMIPDEQKVAYTEAMRRAPRLVEIESNFERCVRACVRVSTRTSGRRQSRQRIVPYAALRCDMLLNPSLMNENLSLVATQVPHVRGVQPLGGGPKGGRLLDGPPRAVRGGPGLPALDSDGQRGPVGGRHGSAPNRSLYDPSQDGARQADPLPRSIQVCRRSSQPTGVCTRRPCPVHEPSTVQ
jgi:hypothetical protein